MSKVAKENIKKVIANVYEERVEPDFIAGYNCPYCGNFHYHQVYKDNYTETVKCDNKNCGKQFKVKIPKHL